jgi:guanylate kinase
MIHSAPRRGVPIVVSAPSGGGKTTLCHKAMGRMPGLEFSVSHTTRRPRGAERPDVDYHFVDDAQFVQLIEQDVFLEWAHVHGRRYGTSRLEAEKRLDQGIDVFFDIDVQGGQQIAGAMPDAVLVFVVPPSMAVLATRLRQRVSDAEDEIQRRLQVAADEIRAAHFYTHWIVNDDLERAVDDLCAIVRAERLRHVDKQALIAGLTR